MKILEMPEDRTIAETLMQKYKVNAALLPVPQKKLILKHDLNLDRLKKSLDDSMEKFGRHPWKTADGDRLVYSGFSLTYNPNHQDQLDPNASSLGTPKNKRGEFFYGSKQNHSNIKNSYFDSYAFVKRTPAASEGYLAEILNTCQRTIIRSRMMILDGQYFDDELISNYKNSTDLDSKFGWHRDEPVFENLRINIPIIGSNSFVFEMLNEEPYFLEPGLAYSWDTNIPHRVWCREKTNVQRYNLIVGVSPWFDFDELNQEWKPNQYFGRMSPLEMLEKGHIFDWLKKS